MTRYSMELVYHNTIAPIAAFRTIEQAQAFIARCERNGFGGMTIEHTDKWPRSNEYLSPAYAGANLKFA